MYGYISYHLLFEAIHKFIVCDIDNISLICRLEIGVVNSVSISQYWNLIQNEYSIISINHQLLCWTEFNWKVNAIVAFFEMFSLSVKMINNSNNSIWCGFFSSFNRIVNRFQFIREMTFHLMFKYIGERMLCYRIIQVCTTIKSNYSICQRMKSFQLQRIKMLEIIYSSECFGFDIQRMAPNRLVVNIIKILMIVIRFEWKMFNLTKIEVQWRISSSLLTFSL